MDRNLKVARTHRALSWLYLVMLGAFLMMAITGDQPAAMIFPCLVMGLLFSMHHFTSKAARDRKPGARTASILIACMMLLGFPIGTLIGLYLLSNSWRAWEPQALPAV